MHRTRVAVLRGGPSDEYAVSLKTGEAVLQHMDRSQFEPLDIIISKSGEWIHDGRTRLPEHFVRSVDVIFIALHGAYGEDGTLQSFLDRYAVPYTGSKAFPSRVAMNKILTKSFLAGSSIKTAPHVHVTKDMEQDVGRIASQITNLFGPQYIIKPVTSGSSVGTMVVKNPLLLPQALTDALQHFDEVMVELRINGREATCGVVERFRDQPLYALPPIEIIPPAHADFFDGNVKYSGETREMCPSSFDHHIKREIEQVAKEAHQLLGLSQYSRSDFIVAHDGVYFLEVNTLPGLTKESLLPKAVEAVGGTYRDFITHLITDAMSARI